MKKDGRVYIAQCKHSRKCGKIQVYVHARRFSKFFIQHLYIRKCKQNPTYKRKPTECLHLNGYTTNQKA